MNRGQIFETAGGILSGLITVKILRIVYPILSYNPYERIVSGKHYHSSLPSWLHGQPFLLAWEYFMLCGIEERKSKLG